MSDIRRLISVVLALVALAVVAAESLAGTSSGGVAAGGLDWTAAALVAAGTVPLVVGIHIRRRK